MSSAVLISEGQNHLVEVLRRRIVFQPLYAHREQSRRGKEIRRDPRHQSALGGGGHLLLLINALRNFGYRCQHFSLSVTEAWPSSKIFQVSLCTGYEGVKGFGARVPAPVRGQRSSG